MEITELVARRLLEVIDRGLCTEEGHESPQEMRLEEAVCCALGEPFSTFSKLPTCISSILYQLDIGLNDAQWSSSQVRAQGLRRMVIAQLGTGGILDERLFINKLGKAVIVVLFPKILRSVALARGGPHKSTLLEAANRCETEGTDTAGECAVAAAFASNKGVAVVPGATSGAALLAVTAIADWDATVNDVVVCAEHAAVSLETAAAIKPSAAYMLAAEHAASCAKAAASLVVTALAATVGGDAVAADKLLGEFAEAVVQILIEMKTPGANFLFLAES